MRDFAHYIKAIILESLEDKEVFLEWFYFLHELPTTTWFILFLILGLNDSCVVIKEKHFKVILGLYSSYSYDWNIENLRNS